MPADAIGLVEEKQHEKLQACSLSLLMTYRNFDPFLSPIFHNHINCLQTNRKSYT